MSVRLLFAFVSVFSAEAVVAQTPDSSATPSAPPAAPRVQRNAFGGIEQREPIGGPALFLGNVVGQSALTMGRGMAEGGRAGQLPAFALGGAVAGAGFYGAKRLVGERHTVAGFALAYASASLAENVAEGGHALSHVRLGLGPLDVRLATPWARDEGPGVGFEIEPLSLSAAIVLPLGGFRPQPCAAGVCYRADEPFRVVRDGRRYRRLGRTIGRVVRTWPPLTPRTDAHEGVHVVQGMQLMAGTPYGTLRSVLGRPSDADVAFDLRTDWLTPLAGGLVYSLVRYERAWPEREAFTLAGPDAEPVTTR